MALPSPLAQLVTGPMFVVGQPRSGTTWVFDILSVHPEVGGVFESQLFDMGSGLARLFDVPHSLDGPVGPKGVRQLISREELVGEVRALAARWLARALEAEHRFLVEKSPSHIWSVDLIAEVFPEARFISVVRDGRDVAVSVLAAANSWAPEWKRSFGRTLYETAKEWTRTLAWESELTWRLGDRFLTVRYEDIKAEPFAAYRRLYDFCELPYDEQMLEWVFKMTDFDTRFKAGGEDHFHRRGRVGEWRERFSVADLVAFHRAAGDALVTAGYDEAEWFGHALAERVRRGRIGRPSQ